MTLLSGVQAVAPKSLLRPGPAVSINAQLTLAIGSRAGTVAPMQSGYYLIGRHKECQIRPKSRSVSRRHCLLKVAENGLHGFDLDSTSGTFVNDQQVVAKQWFPLENGDTIRFGKVLFEVGFETASAAETSGIGTQGIGTQGIGTQEVGIQQEVETRPGTQAQPPTDAVGDAPPSAAPAPTMDTGKAWQEVDVAELLQAADQEDRKRRYENIRTRGQASDEGGDALDSMEADFATVESSSDSTDSIDAPPAKPKTTRAERPAPAKKPKRSFRLPLPSFSLDNVEQVEYWKLVAAAIAAVMLIGYACWSGYSSFSGPSVRILQDL